MLRTVLALCPACASASRLRWAFVLRRKTLDEGADVNALDEYGQTALRLAAESCNQKDVIKALLERGAEVSIRDINGLTAVDYVTIIAPLSPTKGLGQLMKAGASHAGCSSRSCSGERSCEWLSAWPSPC